MHVLYSNSRIFVIPVYIFNGRKQTLVDTLGYCQRCACVVCMTSASCWPNCVSRVARIDHFDQAMTGHCHDIRKFLIVWTWTSLMSNAHICQQSWLQIKTFRMSRQYVDTRMQWTWRSHERRTKCVLVNGVLNLGRCENQDERILEFDSGQERRHDACAVPWNDIITRCSSHVDVHFEKSLFLWSEPGCLECNQECYWNSVNEPHFVLIPVA